MRYTYGTADAEDFGAGRVIEVKDAARIQTRRYDPLGNVVEETTRMELPPIPGEEGAQQETGPGPARTTTFEYDTWGRLLTLTYPDGNA